MAGKSKRSKLVLAPEEVKELQQLAQSRTAPSREVQRARILCRYHAGETITEIARALRMTRHSAGKWIARGLALGVKAALKDTYHRPRPPVITEEAKAWVVHLACSKPKEMGYAAELDPLPSGEGTAKPGVRGSSLVPTSCCGDRDGPYKDTSYAAWGPACPHPARSGC